MTIQRTSIFLFLILAIAFASCDAQNPFDTGPPYDLEGNLAKDSLLIVEYLQTAEIDSLYRIHDPSGVVIIVQEEGEGTRPINGNVIYTDYTGSLMSDGSVFDTTDEDVAKDSDIYVEGRDYRVFTFQINSGTVIQGWDIAFRRLRPGSKAQLIIPSPWGYRSNSTERIPENSVLIFDVDFRGIE
ncbi:FKBP-type peptidyl-prolyl cis-trans isomerase FkpA [Algoriphagus locisalis]|uniref:Peptidyl-prolyl cis-trans isomerase n=1 Tax=Algoriphagus locisalis TaxID=305507 RepID=A0A1I7ACV4_9BACT|nr:FKBP-type peptidyl-prolyl cis-trans isomerase [Algoriphagus locisalis]SFT72703.1 FKBP-type peptidyl-prolyl cis-trans isomerase FkpA [Algoriphagus locisalis]